MRGRKPVTVNFGPFKGRQGTIVSATSAKRVLIQLAVKDRLLLVELDLSMIDPQDKTGEARETGLTPGDSK